MKNTMIIDNSDSILIFDPIPFFGGSKQSVKEIISLTKKKKYIIITSHKDSWGGINQKDNNIIEFSLPNILKKRTQGIGYWIKQFYTFLLLSFYILNLRIHGIKISSYIGTSGPTVDMALYIYKMIFNCHLIQLIQGPIPPTYRCGQCLTLSNEVFYLESGKDIITSTLISYFSKQYPSENIHKTLAYDYVNSQKFNTFSNGLNPEKWPTPTNYLNINVYWAASLLKWKGLDILIEAGMSIPDVHFIVCYLKPKYCHLPKTEIREDLPNFSWYESPQNLNELRSKCSIFISTSENEPFGLSILESLAAGLCVFIPSDNSYWDKTLSDDINCVKYNPNDVNDIVRKICHIKSNPNKLKRIGLAGSLIAKDYTSDKCYKPITKLIESI